MTTLITPPNDLPPEAPLRARRSWTRAEQAAHLADFAASGLSATAFCRRLGVGRSTLTRWRQRAAAVSTAPRRRGRPPTPRPAGGAALGSGFAAVTVVPEAAPTAGPASSASPVAPPLALVLRAPSGVAADVAGLDVATAAALLRALLRAVLTPATAGAA